MGPFADLPQPLYAERIMRSAPRKITDDQARIRQNLPVLPQTSEAFKTYVKKLADQEPDVERLQKSIKELTQRATREQQEIDNFLKTLTVE